MSAVKMRWPGTQVPDVVRLEATSSSTALLLAGYVLSLHLGGCAAPVRGLWPAKSR